jgi:hypothetical protein
MRAQHLTKMTVRVRKLKLNSDYRTVAHVKQTTIKQANQQKSVPGRNFKKNSRTSIVKAIQFSAARQIKSNQIKSNLKIDSNHQIKSNQIRGTLDGPSAGLGAYLRHCAFKSTIRTSDDEAAREQAALLSDFKLTRKKPIVRVWVLT